jgi:hypothetical protein
MPFWVRAKISQWITPSGGPATLLEPNFAPTLEVALHRAWCVGHVPLDPGARNIRLKILQSFEFFRRFVEPIGLSQSCYKQTVGPVECRREPQHAKSAIDGFIIATGKIVRRRHPAIENQACAGSLRARPRSKLVAGWLVSDARPAKRFAH